MGGIDGEGYQERFGNGRWHKGGLHSLVRSIRVGSSQIASRYATRRYSFHSPFLSI
jgi:hypothetical protein